MTSPRTLNVEQLRAAGGDVGRALRLEPGKSMRRSLQAKSGGASEDFLGEHHRRCAEAGVAYLVKRPTPFRVIGPGPRAGTLLVVPEEPAGVDFTGQLLDGTGRHLVAEAKSARDGRVDLARRVTDSQRQELELGMAGGISVLLVVRARELFAVPWALVRDRAAVSVRHLAEHMVTPGECWPARWSAAARR